MNLLQVTMWPAGRLFVTTPSGHAHTASVRQGHHEGQPHGFIDDDERGRLYWTRDIVPSRRTEQK